MTAPDWTTWELGSFFPRACGGHSYADSDVQLNDLRLSAEKAYYVTGKWQVVHHHSASTRCEGTQGCQVFGREATD